MQEKNVNYYKNQLKSCIYLHKWIFFCNFAHFLAADKKLYEP